MPRSFLIMILAAALTGIVSTATTTASPQGRKLYVCPPCPLDCHDATFEKPGICPKCGMTLVERESLRNVAILVWDGVELLDFAGPAEVFSAARGDKGGLFNVSTVAPDASPIKSQGFLKVTPNHTIENCPKPHVLIIPGGNTGPIIDNEKVIEWIRKSAMTTDMVLSVCTGAFVLNKAGVLNGIEATTWHGAIADLRREAKETKVHDDRRFVDNGDVVTCAGVSAGIDGALHALGKITGPDVARRTARYMEYEWHPMVTRGDQQAELRRRIEDDPDGVLNDVKRVLVSGTRGVTEVLSDGDLFGLHENEKFRDLIRCHSYETSATLTPKGEPGKPLIVSGRVTDYAGKPLAGVQLYVFHTGNDGSYSSTGGNVGSIGDSLNPRLFAYLRTGDDGRYEYRTIKPGQYPGNGPPAHVHYEVTARGFDKKVTELMFEGDSRLTPGNRRSFLQSGFIISNVKRGDDGVLRCTCDIVLNRD